MGQLVKLTKMDVRCGEKWSPQGMIFLYLGQEGVEAQNQLAVALEQILHALDDALGVNPAEYLTEAVACKSAQTCEECRALWR